MKYVALLRGINVGGKNIIKMADLKKAVEKCGFTNVITYIQSGNVLFESDQKNIHEIVKKLEAALLKDFAYESRIIVRTHEQLKKTLAEVPPEWRTNRDLSCYLAFIAEPFSALELAPQVELRDSYDFLKAGEGVLYMTTLSSGLTKSKFTKLNTKVFYKEISIRNYNTVQKLLGLMGE
jgi:uncharacterized protein (DUF1697 family)